MVGMCSEWVDGDAQYAASIWINEHSNKAWAAPVTLVLGLAACPFIPGPAPVRWMMYALLVIALPILMAILCDRLARRSIHPPEGLTAVRTGMLPVLPIASDHSGDGPVPYCSIPTILWTVGQTGSFTLPVHDKDGRLLTGVFEIHDTRIRLVDTRPVATVTAYRAEHDPDEFDLLYPRPAGVILDDDRRWLLYDPDHHIDMTGKASGRVEAAS